MGVITHESQGTSVIPPARFFKAFILDNDNNLIPKVLPQAIKSTEIIEGDGGPGTIKKITLGEGSQFRGKTSVLGSNAKHRTDVTDPEHCTFCFSVIEGDALSDKLQSISNETKIEASPEGGSILKSTSKYQTKGDFQLTGEQIQAGKGKVSELIKASC
ncbi:major strawberry allergen Fra a 1.06 [Quercus suber]|uniref:Major allergen pru av 1 n=1 Tax=Quercus suber TaxID=58331 RepID=A0AAW0KJC3_QUESU